MPSDFVLAYVLLAILFCVAVVLVTRLVLYIIGIIRERKLSRDSSFEVNDCFSEDLDNDNYDCYWDEEDIPLTPKEHSDSEITRPPKHRSYHVLRKGGYTISSIAPDNLFKGKTVVFTGELPWIDRDLAACALSNLGARVSSSISGKTDIIIVGNSPGPSKMGKVEELRASGRDVRIMLQWEFAREVRAVFDACPGARHCPYEIDNDFIVC